MVMWYTEGTQSPGYERLPFAQTRTLHPQVHEMDSPMPPGVHDLCYQDIDGRSIELFVLVQDMGAAIDVPAN